MFEKKMISESFIVSGILIGQGAEGKVYRSTFIDRPCVEKVRQPKRYRVPELDTKLNKHRILQECR
jgi:tRNA A-37 threonylcarbamoyl transferase component Bud32